MSRSCRHDDRFTPEVCLVTHVGRSKSEVSEFIQEPADVIAGSGGHIMEASSFTLESSPARASQQQ